MLKIGDFSKLARVTVKALRHYSRLGLLRPVWVDRYSGYRFYSVEQMPRLNRILALKEMGFTLEQVSRLLDAELDAAELRRLLLQKQAELSQRLAAEQSRLVQVEARIRQIEREGSLSRYEVLLKPLASRTVAGLRATLPNPDEAPTALAVLSDRLQSWLRQNSLRTSAPLTAIYHQHERQVDVELTAEVEASLVRRKQFTGSEVSIRRLPGHTLAASTIHSGSYESLPQAYTALMGWVEGNGYRLAGDAMEVLLEPEAVTELQLPVERPTYLSSVQSESKGESEMEPKIITRPAFAVMGMRYFGKNQHNEISTMWDVFNKRYTEIPNMVDGPAYGVCSMVEGAEEGDFEYVAGFEVRAADRLPEGMVMRMVPEQKYAVFEHVGAMEGLKETYHNIYQVWLPQSGYKPINGFDMEVYDEKFKFFAPDSVFYIYVAVQ